MSKELNHLAAILHAYAGGLNSMKWKKIIIFQKENWNTFTLFTIFIVKIAQIYYYVWPPICRNKSAITPKWFNTLDTNSTCCSLIWWNMILSAVTPKWPFLQNSNNSGQKEKNNNIIFEQNLAFPTIVNRVK